MYKMIYEFKTHSIYYDSNDMMCNTFSLTIDTLEMLFELKTGKFIGIQGYFPLLRAQKCKLTLPQIKNYNDYYLDNVSGYRLGFTYDLTVEIPQTRTYFAKMNIKFDREKGIIQVGTNLGNNDKILKIDENIVLIFDHQNILKCIFIVPTVFLN